RKSKAIQPSRAGPAQFSKILDEFCFNEPKKSGVVSPIFYPARDGWLAKIFVQNGSLERPLPA
ncbi:MAG: hypothetical protein SPL71_13465, partial [Oribacterium sp.]|nr:hypothetical protein [Oribacterium sp.]